MKLIEFNSASSLLPVLVRPIGPPCPPPTDELSLEGLRGPDLLNQVANKYRQYMVLPPGAPDALALLVAQFHCRDAFLHSARLSFQAAEKRCGKTTAIDVTASLSPNPFLAEDLSSAVLFRATELIGVTIFLDEIDARLIGNEDIRGILNAGHRYGGRVWRCDGPGRSLRGYNVFAPVVVAGIGKLPDTLQDRSVVVRLTRAKSGEIKCPFDPRFTVAESELRDKLARWTWENHTVLKLCKPILPPDATNRLADNWRPLFAIAEVAGGDWPRRAAEAFQLLNQNELSEDDESTRIKLLRDIRTIFNASFTPKLPSAVLVDELVKLEGHPWAEYVGRRGISTHQVAHLLRGFGIIPHTIRFGSTTAKGYDITDFVDVFERFLRQS